MARSTASTGSSRAVASRIGNNDSHREALEMMADYPLFGMVTWEVRPLLEFKEGLDTVRAKLAEAQAAMAGG